MNCAKLATAFLWCVFAVPGVGNAKSQTASNDENASPETILKEFILKRGRKDLVYDRTRDRFLVLSGYRGKNIFYTKIALSPDRHTVCVLDIFYPRQLRSAYDSEVTRMSRSFTALR